MTTLQMSIRYFWSVISHAHIYSCSCVFINSIFMPTKSPLAFYGSDCFTAFHLIIQTWIKLIMLITVIRLIEYVTVLLHVQLLCACVRTCVLSDGCAIHWCYISILKLLFYIFQLESSDNVQNITWDMHVFHLSTEVTWPVTIPVHVLCTCIWLVVMFFFWSNLNVKALPLCL